MPIYNISCNANGLHVHVEDTAGQEQELLRALQECQEGRCSCPTAEYEKLASMQVTATPDLRLPGSRPQVMRRTLACAGSVDI